MISDSHTSAAVAHSIPTKWVNWLKAKDKTESFLFGKERGGHLIDAKWINRHKKTKLYTILSFTSNRFYYEFFFLFFFNEIIILLAIIFRFDMNVEVKIQNTVKLRLFDILIHWTPHFFLLWILEATIPSLFRQPSLVGFKYHTSFLNRNCWVQGFCKLIQFRSKDLL